jgi:3-oxoadipate enol-lactonase
MPLGKTEQMPTLERGDASLHFEVAGSGEPLVFLHGRGGNSLLWWQQVDFFASRRLCVLIDFRGHGRSRGASAETSVDESDVLAVVDSLGIGAFSAIGHSVGGVVLGGIAHAFPRRVRAAVFSCSHGGMALPPGEDALLRSSLADVGPKIQAWKEGQGPHPALGASFPRLHPSLARLFISITSLNPVPAPGPSREPCLAPGGFPERSLFVAGAADQVVPAEVVRRAAGRVDGAAFALVLGSGHSPYFEEADRFNRLVGKFLDASG